VASLQLWPNGWMDQDATWQKASAQATLYYMGIQWGTSSHSSLSPLRPMSIVAKRSPISATAELLLEHTAKGAQHAPSFRPMSIVATVAHLSYC